MISVYSGRTLRNILLKCSVGLFLFLSVTAHAQSLDSVLDKLIFDESKNVRMTPENKVWEVISVIHWNVASGIVKESQLKLIRESIGADDGPVAKYLMTQGFNYHVLSLMRPVIGFDPLKVGYGVTDISAIQASVIGQSSAGIPEFTRVNTEHWETNAKGNLSIKFETRIHWLLQRMKKMVDGSVKAADTVPHGLLNLFVNRYNQVREILDFAEKVERLLTYYQALDSALKIREAQAQGGQARYEFTDLQKAFGKKMDAMTAWAEKVLSEGTPQDPADKEPWKALSKSIRKYTVELNTKTQEFTKISRETIEGIDRVLGQTQNDNKYVSDTEPELEIKRQEHHKRAQQLKDNWEKNQHRTYYARDHVWTYIHSHSEQHGPYFERQRYQKSEPVHDIAVPPFEEESLLATSLEEIGKKLIESRIQKAQILKLREQLMGLRSQQAQHVQKGPILPPQQGRQAWPKEFVDGFAEHFTVRNQILTEWLDLLIDSSFRHEAHERKGYVGLEVDGNLASKYQLAMDHLQQVAKRFHNAAVGLITTGGVGGIGAACYYFFGM